jgi:alpha-beta hydrolase superfamily lysophospholipase
VDNLALKGFLHLPSNLPAPLVIGSHGMLSDGNSPKQVTLGRRLAAAGVAFFRFDHRGCGQSEGIFREVTTLEARCCDLLGAVDSVRANFDLLPGLALFGSSLGGTTCIAAAARLKTRLHAMVCLAAPVRSRPVIDAVRADGNVAPADIDLLQQHLCFDVGPQLQSLHDILVIHGECDEIVPPDHAREIYRAANGDKKLILQPGGDHRMSNPAHQHEFMREAITWLLDHL